ncbi:replication protein A 70 kDa DNA-binding subunit A isoform X1 [Arachis hypogaea]|uniref:replication protein A 70 kDa DNA-binding subunit A isoform X1 n=1 Tax=Arachis hypogaea TaxID=3818 RepID=UPI003B218AA9
MINCLNKQFYTAYTKKLLEQIFRIRMAEVFDMLMDVNARKLEWNFQVYVVHLWEVPNRFNEKEINGIEIVLQDVQGGRIQASIPKPLLKKWRGKIVEFKMYIMTHFIVVDKKEKTKTTNNRWSLSFSHRTTVQPVSKPSYPLEAFSFKPIPELLDADKLEDSVLIDVIGEVVGKEDPRELITSKGRETKRLAVILEDLENNSIGCVLFGDMVDQILPYLEEGRVEPLIVIAQFFKPSRWNGKTSVQSHFDVSKLRINPDLDEVKDFRNRRLSEKPSNSTRISQVTSHGPRSGADEIKNGDVVVKTIEEALSSSQEGPIWIAGTIVSINAGKDDWFYKSCRKCPKKVETPIGNRYECGKCGHTHASASLRFKVEVLVYDGTGSIMLLMWDRETAQLCGRQAEQIKDEESSDGEGYPPTLDSMMDRRLLFKINVKASNMKQYDHVYTVMKICDDEDIVEMNHPKPVQNNASANLIETGCSDSIGISAVVVNMHNDTESMVSLDGVEDSVTSLKSKTPAKRAPMGLKQSVHVNIDTEDEFGFSTNKFSRKTGKRQRIQINESDN